MGSLARGSPPARKGSWWTKKAGIKPGAYKSNNPSEWTPMCAFGGYIGLLSRTLN
jgi:hypothetical protein